ncbi:MAG: hypothetical protein Q7V57_11230 [Actinomycetota bacterium]|nr:hypothetical protein [Actinomycetota bacterium]
MSRHWLFPPRAVEATAHEIAMTGAAGGGGYDPIDGDRGFVQLGASSREIPQVALERARTSSIAAYRANPMARAIIDTYTSFAVGDSGVSILCQDPIVRPVIDAWWNDPKNRFAPMQAAMMRYWMLMGEFAPEYMVGEQTGIVRWCPIDVSRITTVELEKGNPLWPSALHLRSIGESQRRTIAQVDDITGLRTGDAGFFPGWQTLLTDRRGQPFLSPILDDLDAYGMVLSNLIDRTALARYMVWDVTVNGDQTTVDDFIAKRGGQHAPSSGTIEVHNEGVKWEPQTADTGSFQDTNTLASILTNVAGGMGLAKTWLADSEGANRATSMSMAEPVRRRVGGVQSEWVGGVMTEMGRYQVDRAVAAGRLPRMVESTNSAGDTIMIPAADTVTIKGPAIAAADSQVTAAVFLNLSQALDHMMVTGVLPKEAAALAAQTAWEQFVGQPLPSNLAAKAQADPTSAADDLAELADKAGEAKLLRFQRT